jgi:hypothetical protein
MFTDFLQGCDGWSVNPGAFDFPLFSYHFTAEPHRLPLTLSGYTLNLHLLGSLAHYVCAYVGNVEQTLVRLIKRYPKVNHLHK